MVYLSTKKIIYVMIVIRNPDDDYSNRGLQGYSLIIQNKFKPVKGDDARTDLRTIDV